MKRKSIGESIFPGEEDGQILGWWGDSPSRENPVIPYIKAKKKNSFYNLDNFKNQATKYLLSKHRFKFLLFKYLNNKMYI